MANAVRLINLGVPEPTAKEMAAQIEAQAGDRKRLEGVAVEPLLAQELAGQIDAGGTVSAVRLVDFAMVPEVAVELAAQITADRA